MKISVLKINPKDESLNFKFIECLIRFWDDETHPHFSAEVTIFLEKNDNLTISEIKILAMSKVQEFLLKVLSLPHL